MTFKNGVTNPRQKIWRKRVEFPPSMRIHKMLHHKAPRNGHGRCLPRTGISSSRTNWIIHIIILEIKHQRNSLRRRLRLALHGALHRLSTMLQERWEACQMLMSQQRDLLTQALKLVFAIRVPEFPEKGWLLQWSKVIWLDLSDLVWQQKWFDFWTCQVLAKIKHQSWIHRKKLRQAEILASARVYENKSIIGGCLHVAKLIKADQSWSKLAVGAVGSSCHTIVRNVDVNNPEQSWNHC